MLHVPGAFALDVMNSRIESVLTRAIDKDALRTNALARELVAFGPLAERPLFDALVNEASVAPELTSARADLLLSTFEVMGTARWRPLLFGKTDAAPGAGAIRSVCAIAGRAGSAEDLPLILRAAGMDHDAECRDALIVAVTSILKRDDAGFGTIESAVLTVRPELRSALVRAVERTQMPKAALMLARWIDTRRDMRTECLPHLARLSLSLDKPLPSDVVASVRALVEDGDEVTMRDAVLCIGRLGDSDAIPALIRCLREGEFGLRSEALWALHNITGLKLCEDPISWTSWYESEADWWSRDSRVAFAMFTSGSKAEKMAVLNVVSRLHAWRDRLSSEIAIALDDPDVDVATLTASELQRLDSSLVIPALIDALAGDRPTVAKAAHAALESITKRKLPEDSLACRDALVPQR